jgi:hypothetical protein
MEFEVIQGMGHFINQFDIIIAEVSETMIYAGQHVATEVDELLASLGYRCALGCEKCHHCDRLYRRLEDQMHLFEMKSSGVGFPS